MRQCIEAGEIIGHKRIPGIFSLHHAGELKPWGQLHGNIFKRVHRQVGPALFQRRFQLFHEQAFTAHLGERPIQNLVSSGGHAQNFNRLSRGLG